MHVGLIGISYKSSDLQERELLANASKKLLDFQFRDPLELSLVLLSTCNRTEIYFSSPDLAQGHSAILSELKKQSGGFFDHVLYSYFGEKCFTHLAQVTCGVDSVIFGEAEIQRQVKDAYEESVKEQTLPSSLHYLFQKSLKIGKEIRTEFSLPKSHVSIESTVFDLTRYFFGKDRECSLLFVGYSEINRKIIPYLKTKGFLNIHLATKSPLAAKEFADSFSVKLLPWLELSLWSEKDVVICGSKASQFLLRYDHISKESCFIKNRLVIDLGLPRNAEPSIARHPSIMLFNIEEMGCFIDLKQKGLLKENEKIKTAIGEIVSRQVYLFNFKRNRQPLCAF